MDTEAGKELSENYPPKETTTVDSKSLTVKILTSANSNGNNKEIRAHVVTSAQDSVSKALLTYSSTSSPYKSSPISPPSSAFVSALQSPYISPRTNFNIIADKNKCPNPNEDSPTPAAASTHPTLPVSCSGSQSDDVPCTSYTPPPDRDNNGDRSNTRIKIVTCVPVSGQETTGTRATFSFQIPQISFSKGYVSSPASSNARLRTCDVYIGFHGQNPNLIRFCKWLKSELEGQGIACFVVDRAKYGDNQSLEIADRVICSAAFGVAVVTSCGLCNFSLEEIRFFAQKKNLIPLFFETNVNEISSLINPHGDNKECREAIDGLIRYNEYRLEANVGNWRSCISKTASILRAKLGRMSVTEKEMDAHDELLPFPRNKFFVGREREILNIQTAFFGSRDFSDTKEFDVPKINNGTMEQSEYFADREKSESYRIEGGKKFMTPANGIVCINGSPGIGKTELALEFAHRYSQRYKMVFWVGGEARHLRQNILNLSINLGLDVSAGDEKERGTMRPFDKQEAEAFKRVKRELFGDMPYLLIIDNLETESEWWEGKDLNDLIPRNTGGTQVIITTRLPKVMNFDMILLRTLPLTDAMMLIRGRRKKDYPASEREILGKFDEKLGRSSFGLWVVGSLLSELAITPSALFEAVNEIQFGDEPGRSTSLSSADQQFCRTSHFLMKLLSFCDAMLQQNQNSLASRLLQVGAWFAPSSISANLLADAANNVPYSATKNKLKKWKRCLKLITLSRYSACLANQAWKDEEEESALLLVKLGLARKVHNKQCGGCYVQFHPITQTFSKWQYGNFASKSVVLQCVRNHPNPLSDSDHLWASAFLVFGFKTKPPIVKLKATEMVLFIKRTALPLAIHAFATFSRCHSALELLKVCTNALEEVEKSFVSRIQDQCLRGSLCSKKAVHSSDDDDYPRVDECAWQEVILLKATLLETRAKLMLKGGLFDSGEELCRTCASIRTVMLGHNHAQTLDAQETLAKLVRMRSRVLV